MTCIPADPVAGGTGVSKYYMALPDGEQPPKSGINGGFGSLPEGYGGHVTFYIAVDDVGAALEKIEKLGGKRMIGQTRKVMLSDSWRLRKSPSDG